MLKSFYFRMVIVNQKYFSLSIKENMREIYDMCIS
jgi:hypothetical protein